jgi:NAD(P)-dependent dehydrogenase (short-subunit alcohol dehydrogenase family)
VPSRSGHIVNVSSLGGLVAFGATGYYHATKFAVEGLSESLAAEVAPLGIRVTIVEPAAFRTNWSGPRGRRDHHGGRGGAAAAAAAARQGRLRHRLGQAGLPAGRLRRVVTRGVDYPERP